LRNQDYGFGEEGGNAAVVGGTYNDMNEEEGFENNENLGSINNNNPRGRLSQMEAVGGAQFEDGE
jgi:hypothetical protein